jgi:D-glycero-alpha-D-manno-heptose-7-phosphate kinase
MILTRTPVRVSFLGGGTDYPEWVKENGGLVVGGAISRYSYVTARYLPPFFEHKSRFVYNEIELVKEWGQIEHRYIRAALKLLRMDSPESPGIELMHYSDLPSQSGTGSSSAFAVGIIHALAALKHSHLDHEALRDNATWLEQEMLSETVGFQDQAFAAFGGLRRINFHKDLSVTSYPIPISADQIKDFESHLLMIFTGLQRRSSEVAKQYVPSLLNKAKDQWAMMQMAEDGYRHILSGAWKRLGLLMDSAWKIKRGLSEKVSNNEIDNLYLRARLHGSWGGKLMGAGGGGCMLFVVPPENREAVLTGLGNPIEIKFKFDHDGSQVIYTDRQS